MIIPDFICHNCTLTPGEWLCTQRRVSCPERGVLRAEIEIEDSTVHVRMELAIAYGERCVDFTGTIMQGAGMDSRICLVK